MFSTYVGLIPTISTIAMRPVVSDVIFSNRKMKKNLIFGGTQFVGKILINNLLEKNYGMTVATRRNWPIPNKNALKHIVADRYDSESFGELTKKDWDVVVDQLAFTGYDAKILVDAFRGNVKKIVYVTSNAVYDEGHNLKEDNFDPQSMSEVVIDLKNYREPKVDTADYQQGKREVEYIYTLFFYYSKKTELDEIFGICAKCYKSEGNYYFYPDICPKFFTILFDYLDEPLRDLESHDKDLAYVKRHNRELVALSAISMAKIGVPGAHEYIIKCLDGSVPEMDKSFFKKICKKRSYENVTIG